MTAESTPATLTETSHPGRVPWLTGRKADIVFAPRWWWPALAVVTAFGIHVSVAWERLGPLFSADEVSVVGEAQVIATGSTQWTLAGSGYMPGTSLLLAPAWWFSHDSFVVYRVGLALGVLLAMLTIIPLAVIACELGIKSRNGALTLAAIVMLAPARTVPSNYVISEALLVLATATLIALAFRVTRRASPASMAVLGAVAGTVFLAHGRGIAVTCGACVWALIFAGTRWRLSGMFIAAAGVVVMASWTLYEWIVGELFWADDRLGQTFNGLSSHNLAELAGTAIGLGWYTIGAWPAVGIVGLMIAIKRFRRFNGEALLLLTLAPTLVLALIQLDKGSDIPGFTRLDAWIYGRYIDHLLTIAAVMGLAVLVRVSAWMVQSVVVVGTAVVGVAFLLITAPQIHDGAYWSHVHVAGVVYMLSEANFLNNAPEPWVLLTFAAWALSCAVAISARVRAVPIILGALWVALSISTDRGIINPHDELKRIPQNIAAPLETLEPGAVVGFDKNFGLGINAFAFGLQPRQVVITTTSRAATRYPAFYTAHGISEPLDFGALPYAGPAFYGYWLWFFPGPAFDELNANSMLAHPEATNDN